MNIFSWFVKKVNLPHVCEFECVGYAPHYNMLSPLLDEIENPTRTHYPSKETILMWYRQGNNYALTFQSHWKCLCGKKKTFFFLEHPCKNSGGKVTPERSVISQKVYDEMVLSNPFSSNSSSGISMNELIKNLTDELC